MTSMVDENGQSESTAVTAVSLEEKKGRKKRAKNILGRFNTLRRLVGGIAGSTGGKNRGVKGGEAGIR